MAEVLLAHAFYIRNDPKQVEKMRPYAPLGTLYAASHLRKRGYQVALFDAMLAQGVGEYLEMLERLRPSFVALYEDQFNFLNKMCLEQTRKAAVEMGRAARRQGAQVVIAGSDISDHPEAYLGEAADFALMGEADDSLCLLLDRLSGRRKGPVEKVPGLAMADPDSPGRIIRNPLPEPEREPDRFSFPAWDLLDTDRYREAWTQAHGYFSLNLVSTRGCPFHCNWCAKPIWGQRYAMRSPADVAEELALVKEQVNPDHIWFADDIFGLQPRWVEQFADEVERRDASIPFMIQSRVDLMTQKAVDALSRAGCVEVWMGAESGSQKILDAMDKGTKLPKIKAARRRLGEAGIKACFFIQFGYPGETFEDVMATVNMVRELLPDDIGISVSYPLPGTKFHSMVKAQLEDKHHWKDSNDLAMMFQGTYQTPFYRKLHRLLHRDLELRHELRQSPSPNGTLLERLDRLNAHWFELGQMELQYRSESPTAIEKDYAQPLEPDLSKRWN
ncbi:MAG TPA: radical SAM protein [Acidobacteriota bacterium]|nr:radical SAM protein [Acidobacteriota bacterium]